MEEKDAAAALGDPDAGCILGLFPQPVRQAIAEACLASSGGSGSSGQGGTAQRRLVELCVDNGGPRHAGVDALPMLLCKPERARISLPWPCTIVRLPVHNPPHSPCLLHAHSAGRPVVVRYGDGGEDDLPVRLEVEVRPTAL